MEFFYLTSFIFIALLLYIYIRFLKCHISFQIYDTQFPSPKMYPLIGNLNIFMQSPENIFKIYLKLIQKHGESPLLFWIGNIPLLAISDADNFRIVSNKILNRIGPAMPYFERLVGTSLLNLRDLHVWKNHRRYLTPPFSYEMMNHYFEISDRSYKKTMLQELETYADRNLSVDIFKVTFKSLYSLNCDTLFGEAVFSDEDVEYLFDNQPILEKTCVEQIYTPWRHISILNHVYEYVTGLKEIFNKNQEIIDNAIQLKRYHQYHKNSETCEDKDTPKLTIDHCLELEEKSLFSKDEVQMEMKTILHAATSTVSKALSMSLLMLAIHKQSQGKVVEEIQKVMGPDAKLTDKKQLDDLVYMKQCIDETLRLFPPNHFTTRHATEDFQLKDGQTVVKGTYIALGIFAVQRNEKVFENPDKWDPNRFSPKEINAKSPHNLFTFGSGARSCLGMGLKIYIATVRTSPCQLYVEKLKNNFFMLAQNYTLLVIQIGLVAVLRKYELDTNIKLSDIRFYYGFNVQISSDTPIFLKRRNH